MTFSSHAVEFAGRPVTAVPADGPLPTVDGPVAWSFSVWDYDVADAEGSLHKGFAEGFERFVAEAGPRVEALVIGAWGYAAFNDAPIAQICAAASRLPNLRALFLGDQITEECEVSWMRVGDVSELLNAYPALEILRVRGSAEHLTFSRVRHAALRELAVETGGLSRELTGNVLTSELPALTTLELWIGTEDYGRDTGLADLAPLLGGEVHTGVRRLGLRNAEIADDLAANLATAPVVPRLETLDLSLGTLGDRGGEALLSGQPLTHLSKLDLHHHYLSAEVAQRIVDTLPGVTVDVSDEQQDDEYDGESYRYTAVGE